MIKSNESGAGKVIMKLQACLMILSICGEEKFHGPRRNLKGIFANTGEKLYKGFAISVFFLKGERVFFWNNKLKKMLSWILKLKIIFLYKWYSEINYTTKKKKKTSTQYSLQSIQHREKTFISLSSWCISCVMEKHRYIKRNELRKIKTSIAFLSSTVSSIVSP